jgi:hypothetical protein
MRGGEANPRRRRRGRPVSAAGRTQFRVSRGEARSQTPRGRQIDAAPFERKSEAIPVGASICSAGIAHVGLAQNLRGLHRTNRHVLQAIALTDIKSVEAKPRGAAGRPAAVKSTGRVS